MSGSPRPLGLLLAVAPALVGCAQGTAADLGDVPDAAGAADAAPGPSDAAACVLGPVQLLTNAAFDDTPVGTGWTEDAFDVAIIQPPPDGVTAESGTTVAWLAGYATASDDHLSQDVVIPAEATELTVTGFVWVETEETGAGDFDVAQLRLATTGGVTVEVLGDWSNQSEDGAWLPFSATLGSAHAGETLRLQLDASTDGSLLTSFLFDTMAVTARACLP
jgi:hypothetical protein